MFKLCEEHAREKDWYELDFEIDKLLKSREAKDILDKLSASPPEIEEEIEEDPVKALFAGKLTRARLKVEQLKELVGVRDQLHSESVSQVDYQISIAAKSLEEFRFWGVGYNQGLDFKRNHLERQLALFRRERRDIRLKTWQDLSSLRKELAEATAEYQEVLRRYRMTGYKV